MKRNLGRDKFKEIESADNWKCLVCDPKPIEAMIRECNRVLNKFEDSLKTDKVSLKLDRVSSAVRSERGGELSNDVRVVVKLVISVADFAKLVSSIEF